MTRRADSRRPGAARPLVAAAALSLTLVQVAAVAAATGASPPHPATSSSIGFASTPGGPAWSEVPAAQRQVLTPLAPEWNGLDATGREKWLEVARRFPRMGPEEQARVRARMVEWVRMTPQQRSQARLVFQENRDVSRAQRQALWQQYQALPEDQKKQLAAKELARRAPAASASAASGPSPVSRHRPTPLEDVEPKSNVVRTPNPSALSPRPVAPVIVQGRPGATTVLVNRTPTPPPHQREGGPKIAVGDADVDRNTLLPRRGPQRAGSVGSAASTSPSAGHPSTTAHPVPAPVTAHPAAAPVTAHPAPAPVTDPHAATPGLTPPPGPAAAATAGGPAPAPGPGTPRP